MGFGLQNKSFTIVLYIRLKQIIKKDGFDKDLVLCISCWLDGGRSECELAVDCKEGLVFKSTKWLELVISLEHWHID